MRWFLNRVYLSHSRGSRSTKIAATSPWFFLLLRIDFHQEKCREVLMTESSIDMFLWAFIDERIGPCDLGPGVEGLELERKRAICTKAALGPGDPRRRAR